MNVEIHPGYCHLCHFVQLFQVNSACKKGASFGLSTATWSWLSHCVKVMAASECFR